MIASFRSFRCPCFNSGATKFLSSLTYIYFFHNFPMFFIVFNHANACTSMRLHGCEIQNIWDHRFDWIHFAGTPMSYERSVYIITLSQIWVNHSITLTLILIYDVITSNDYIVTINYKNSKICMLVGDILYSELVKIQHWRLGESVYSNQWILPTLWQFELQKSSIWFTHP